MCDQLTGGVRCGEEPLLLVDVIFDGPVRIAARRVGAPPIGPDGVPDENNRAVVGNLEDHHGLADQRLGFCVDHGAPFGLRRRVSIAVLVEAGEGRDFPEGHAFAGLYGWKLADPQPADPAHAYGGPLRDQILTANGGHRG